MSESSEHKAVVRPAAQVAQDIRDELTDHLATSAETAAAREGLSVQQALEQSLARFGNVDRIARRCWWIQMGDHAMKRILWIVGLVVLVAVAVGFLMPAFAQLGSLSTKVDALTDQLSRLNTTQKAMLAEQQRSANSLLAQQRLATRQLSIRGRAYLGRPDVPAKQATIEVWRASDMTKVRTLTTDDRGRWNIGFLPRDQYFVIAPLVSEHNPWVETSGKSPLLGGSRGDRPVPVSQFNVQTGPIFSSDSFEASVDLDLEFSGGEVSFKLKDELPDAVTGPMQGWKTDLTLVAYVRPLDLPYLPRQVSMPDLQTRFESNDDVHWPVIGLRGAWVCSQRMHPSALLNGRIDRFGLLPVGEQAGNRALREKQFPGITYISNYATGPREHMDLWPAQPHSLIPRGRYQVAAMLFAPMPRFFKPGAKADAGQRAEIAQKERPDVFGSSSAGYIGASPSLYFNNLLCSPPADLLTHYKSMMNLDDTTASRLGWQEIDVRPGKRTHLSITIEGADSLVRDLEEVLDMPSPTDDDFRRAFKIRPAQLEVIGQDALLDSQR